MDDEADAALLSFGVMLLASGYRYGCKGAHVEPVAASIGTGSLLSSFPEARRHADPFCGFAESADTTDEALSRMRRSPAGCGSRAAARRPDQIRVSRSSWVG
jgi:hypothetical protein